MDPRSPWHWIGGPGRGRMGAEVGGGGGSYARVAPRRRPLYRGSWNALILDLSISRVGLGSGLKSILAP
jgi:hypothetical protein